MVDKYRHMCQDWGFMEKKIQKSVCRKKESISEPRNWVGNTEISLNSTKRFHWVYVTLKCEI